MSSEFRLAVKTKGVYFMVCTKQRRLGLKNLSLGGFTGLSHPVSGGLQMAHEARSKMARGMAIFGPDGRSNSGAPKQTSS